MVQRTPAEPRDAAVAEGGFDELTPEEARAVFEADIRRLLGISGDEFLRRYDAGELVPFDEEGENVRVVSAILSMTLVRPCTWEGGHLRFLS
jgi:hypothetical protein